MDKILFGFIGASLAVGGAYFLYKKWQKYQQQCQKKNNEPTLGKSARFIPNLNDGIMRRNRLSVCAKETNGNASSEGETEAAITEDLDIQICHAESLKAENSSAENDKTGHDVQHGQDLPLRADGAWYNTSNISWPNFVEMYLKGNDIDLNTLQGEMKEFFASLSKTGRVPHTDSQQTTAEPGQIFEPGPSSYSSSPSTSVFQPNGAGTKRASNQLANRRRSTKEHKTN